jgi:hypothetical protein
LGLSAANALAESGGSANQKVASSATVDNAAARDDPGEEKSSTVKGSGHTVPKMRAINLEASTLELPPPRSSDVVDEQPVAPASPEEVVSKLRETLGATSQSEWIATHYEKALLVDKETVHYGPSRRGATYADLEFGIGFSNIYTLDCAKRQFLRTKTIKWSDGWVQDMPMGDKWWPLQPSTTEMNAVYEAICPNLLAAVSGAAPQVNSKSVENKEGAAVTGAVLSADRLEVKDGSALSGQIAEGKVSFKSSLGTVEVNVNDIRSFADGKLHLADGTVLTGTFAAGAIEIVAGVGTLKVPTESIVSIVRQGEGAAGGGASGPSRSAILSYLQTRFEPTMEVTELRYESFSDPARSEGRISAAGTLTLKTDLYRSASDMFQADTEKVAERKSDWRVPIISDAFSEGAANVYQIAYPKSTTVPFAAELMFRRVVDGWEMSGFPRYEKLRGSSKSELKGTPIFVGDAAYAGAVNRVRHAKQQYESGKEAFKRKIENFLQPGNVLAVYSGKFNTSFEDDPKPRRIFTMTANSSINWEAHDGHSSEVGSGFGTVYETFVLPGNASWQSGGRYASERFAAGDKRNVRIYGYIGSTTGVDWNGQISISVAEKQDPSRFHGTGNSTLWNGRYFLLFPYAVVLDKD